MDTPAQHVGLAPDKYDRLSLEAKAVYNIIYDYCTYAADPQYQTLHKFRNRIDKFTGTDRQLLIEYFNHDPAIQWHGMPCEPFAYYSQPY